ncbi:TRAP transporter substrate-binding protein [Pelagibacterium sp.]|uniref:TRAP transporter substrate-binding protein n=1 Tax=Pelagibacterium sp. TaxID=1967288 RepID=UPI003A92FC5A
MKTIVLGTAAILAMATTASAAEWTYAHYNQPTHELHLGVALEMAQDVEAATNGELTIRVFPSGELGAGPAQQYSRALDGIADVTQGLVASDTFPLPRTMLMELPNLFDTPQEAVDVLWENIELFEPDFQGTKVMALFPNNPAALVLNRPVSSPADLKGLNIRASSAIGAGIMEAWGATPVTMPAGDLYNALQTGVIDGALIGIDGINAYRLQEVASHVITNLPGNITMFYVVANRDSWDGLSEDVQAEVLEVTEHALSMKGADAFAASGEEAIEAINASGNTEIVVLTAEQRALFAEPLPAMIENYLEQVSAAEGFDAQEIYTAISQ